MATTPLAHDLKHAAEAVANLVQQYQTPNMQALITALCAPAQDLEDALWQVYTNRWLATAAGTQLDVIGKILGQPRPPGFTDPQYVPYLNARILINKSSGTAEEIYSVFRLVVPNGITLAIVDYLICNFELQLGAVALAATYPPIFQIMLKAMRAAGVGAYLRWFAVDPSVTFTWDGTAPAQGWDNGSWAGVLLC